MLTGAQWACLDAVLSPILSRNGSDAGIEIIVPFLSRTMDTMFRFRTAFPLASSLSTKMIEMVTSWMVAHVGQRDETLEDTIRGREVALEVRSVLPFVVLCYA